MSPMNVSVHAVSPDVRRRMMGRNAQRGMDVLEAIMAAGIEIHAQIVLCPGMNDGEELLKTLRFARSTNRSRAWASCRSALPSIRTALAGHTATSLSWRARPSP